MDQRVDEAAATQGNATESRRTDRELIITRTFDGPARHIFEAWTKPELLMRWWAPKSFGINFISCELDVRSGGTYRFLFGVPGYGSADGILRQIPRGKTTDAAGLDERGKRRC